MHVLGHRGAAGLEPENTLRSFQKAMELGVDAVEMDVHLTRDGHVVVLHDSKVDRTTNGKGPVREMSFEVVRKLDAGKGERIPTLQEVIDLCKGKVIMQVELKADGTPEPVVRLVEQNGLVGRVRLTCGDLKRIREVKRLNPAIETGAIFGAPPADACEQSVAAGASRFGIHFHHATREWVERAHQFKLAITPWCPDTAEDIQRMIALVPDQICTNRPDIALKLLGRL
jgi:glycerophosphoryl diester phosphodiesterase